MAVKKDPRLAVPIDGSLGTHLRKAREEANMSVDKVATSLLLHPDTIAALEADAYDRLPAPTFVRGYLRGYARVLGLPSRPILEMYDRQGFEPPPLAPDVTESQQAHTSDTAVRLVTYAVAAVLVVLVGLWWHSQEDGGFGISGDLFDGSSESDRDPSLPADEGAGTAAIGGESDRPVIGMAPDGPDGPRRESGTAAVPPATDSAPGTEAVDATVAMEPTEPSESSPSEESVVATVTADTASGDVASTDSAAGEAAPAEIATGGAIDAAATGAPSRNEEPAVTAPVEESTPGRMDTVVPATAESAGPEATEDGDTSGTQGSPVEADADADSADGVVVASTEAAEPGAAEDREASATQDASAGARTAAVPETPSTAGADAADAGASGDSGALPTAGSEAEQSGLVLEFAHESWVEVYDRERTRLFFGLVPPGRMLSFDGAQPFDVLLGFGKDVRVTIDGRAFDHTPYLKHGVARFSVGAGDEADAGGADSAGTTTTDAAGRRAAHPVPEARGN